MSPVYKKEIKQKKDILISRFTRKKTWKKKSMFAKEKDKLWREMKKMYLQDSKRTL